MEGAVPLYIFMALHKWQFLSTALLLNFAELFYYTHICVGS